MLTPNQQAEFARRSPSDIGTAFGRLQSHWAAGRWLGANNRYSSNCTDKLEEDFAPGERPIHKHLSEYIAASAIVHSLDGWAYLGRAIHALLVGDHDAARHLGYYAELRAAMSLLASEGIGVFNRKHVVVSRLGRCSLMPRSPGTHVFVWEALEEWVNSPSAASHVLGMISGGESRLDEWMNHVGAIPAFQGQLAKAWLLGWGLDISQLADDREARNLSSYRPTSLTTGRPLDANSVFKFVSTMWRLCEPTEENPFAALDRVLIRASLQRAFRAAQGHPPASAKQRFSQFVHRVLASLQPTAVPGIDWHRFITELNTSPFDVLKLAAKRDSPRHPWHAVQVISRAFLLLRISTGSSEGLISQLPAGAAARLAFWVTQIGADRGLWPLNPAHVSSVDLWVDAADAIEEIGRNLAQIDSFFALWRMFPSAAEMLSSSERICLWGLRL
jgi:hypothetical protein